MSARLAVSIMGVSFFRETMPQAFGSFELSFQNMSVPTRAGPRERTNRPEKETGGGQPSRGGHKP